MTYEGRTYARIKGVGGIVLADKRMPVHQAINVRTYQSGLPTKYWRYKNGYLIPENMRCFLSLCSIRIEDYKQAPNPSKDTQPHVF